MNKGDLIEKIVSEVNITKADAARGYALAADMLHFRYMKMMKK